MTNCIHISSPVLMPVGFVMDELVCDPYVSVEADTNVGVGYPTTPVAVIVPAPERLAVPLYDVPPVGSSMRKIAPDH
jgi:hypothetical protein